MPAPPAPVAALLHDGEDVRWYAQPVAPARGRWVWGIMLLGVLFLAAAVGALDDVVRGTLEGSTLQRVIGAGVLLLALAFTGFSVLLVLWPAIAFSRMRRTHVIITDARVLEVVLRPSKEPRVRTWGVAECTDAAVGLRRGDAASLVLRERVRTRSTDGQNVYEWEALHGLPRTDEAVALLRELQAGGVSRPSGTPAP